MLRARFPLAAAALAATIALVPATSALAADEGAAPPLPPATNSLAQSDTSNDSSNPTTTNKSTDSSTTNKSATTSNDTADKSSTTSSDPGATDSKSSLPDVGSQAALPDLTGGLIPGGSGGDPENPCAGTPLENLCSTLTDPTSVPDTLSTFASCLQDAGTDTTAGQKCVETFLGDLGLPGTECFSQNGFTLQDALDQIQTALAGGQESLTPEALQAQLTKLQDQGEGLISCLAPTPPPVDSGQQINTPTSNDVAPPAAPVNATPNFTG